MLTTSCVPTSLLDLSAGNRRKLDGFVGAEEINQSPSNYIDVVIDGI